MFDVGAVKVRVAFALFILSFDVVCVFLYVVKML